MLQAPHALRNRRLTSAPANPNLVVDLLDPSSELCLPSDFSGLRGRALRRHSGISAADASAVCDDTESKIDCFSVRWYSNGKPSARDKLKRTPTTAEQRTCMQSIHGRGRRSMQAAEIRPPTTSYSRSMSAPFRKGAKDVPLGARCRCAHGGDKTEPIMQPGYSSECAQPERSSPQLGLHP